jgi:muramidase (phage lysozyme)
LSQDINTKRQKSDSTAYGYGQFLTGTRNEYEKKTGLDYSDPVNQLIMMAQYVKDRYGTPENALKFWHSHNPHWY